MQTIEFPIATLINRFLSEFIKQYQPGARVANILQKIARCRTDFFGGRRLICSGCGLIKEVFNSCGDRNCPTCQSIKKEIWIDKRKLQLLTVKHFHVIFTVPHELNVLFLHRPVAMYGLLFRSGWLAIRFFTEKQHGAGARTGMIAALHTWSSAMLLHPHLHCIVPSGALLPNKSWENGKGNGDFFVRGHKLTARFKHYFLLGLRELWESDEFDFGVDTETGEVLNSKSNPELIALASAEQMQLLFNLLWQKTWNVRIEKPMSGIDQVVNYLGRYVYRIAITNSRIKEVDEKTVRFEYNNYAATPEGEAAKKDEMTLSGLEFLRRFSMHILPLYFQRIRYFGFYAVAAKECLTEARKAVGNRDWCIPLRTVVQIVATFLGHDADLCPICKAIRCWRVEEILPTNLHSWRNKSGGLGRSPPTAKPNRSVI